MPLSAELLRAYRATRYRVRVSQGGYAVIRIGEPLPAPLAALLPNANAPWGYITAWNPDGFRQPPALNRANQHRLLAALRAAHLACHPGRGVGTGDTPWREASLFVPGIGFAELDALGRRFRQLAVVRGRGIGPAELRELV